MTMGLDDGARCGGFPLSLSFFFACLGLPQRRFMMRYPVLLPATISRLTEFYIIDRHASCWKLVRCTVMWRGRASRPHRFAHARALWRTRGCTLLCMRRSCCEACRACRVVLEIVAAAVQ